MHREVEGGRIFISVTVINLEIFCRCICMYERRCNLFFLHQVVVLGNVLVHLSRFVASAYVCICMHFFLLPSVGPIFSSETE